ncbi:MAG TPA: SRPBCC family protein [Actinomycetota bacterium]
MAVDVTAERTIARPREEVAGFAFDPANDTAWIGGVREAELLTDPPVREGSQVRRVASFLGRRIEYVMEVARMAPGRRMLMRSVRSPFPMRVTYEFDEAPSGAGTLARIRVEGAGEGFYRIAAPLLAAGVRRGISRDLRTLQGLLESPG